MKSIIFTLLGLICFGALAAQNAPDLTFSFVSPTCNGYTDGTASAVVKGGTEPYTYQWSNGQAGQTNFGLSAGVYTVTVTDAGGRTATGSVTVSQPAALDATIKTTAASVCAAVGSPVSVVVSGGVSPLNYSWSTGDATPSITPTQGGLIYITVTDANGCGDVAGYFLAPQLILETQKADMLCHHSNDGVIKAAVAGGTTPYKFAWSNGATGQDISNLAAGTYSVTVTDANGCSQTAQETIVEPTPIEVTISTITAACGLNNGGATISATGGKPPYKFVWNNGLAMGPTLSGVAPGSYYVCTFDANGCQKDVIIDIPGTNALTVSLAITKAECPGVDNGTASAIVSPANSSYKYEWNIQNSPNLAQLNNIAAGTMVSVTVTDVNTGCQGVATNVIGTHNQVKVNVTDTDVACLGATTGTALAVASNGTAPYTYKWTYPDNSAVTGDAISGLGVGAYAVSVTDARGCTGVGVADINALSQLKADFSFKTLDCVDEKVKVEFTDASSDPTQTIVKWNWNIKYTNGSLLSDQKTPPLADVPENTTGVATLTVTSAAGCEATVSKTFEVKAPPKVNLSVPSPAVSCDGSPVHIKVTADANYNYTWTPATGLDLSKGPLDVLADPDQTTVYVLRAENGGCFTPLKVEVIRPTPVQITLDKKEIITCDPNAKLSATFNVPANGLTLTWKNAQGETIGNQAAIEVPVGSATVYTLVATDQYQCSVSASATVSGNAIKIDPNLLKTGLACENTSVAGTAISQNPDQKPIFKWSVNSPAVKIANDTSAATSFTGPAGDYIVTLLATYQGCSETLTAPLKFTAGESLDGKIKTDLCNGLKVNFENTSNFKGVWDFGDGATSDQDDPNHTYSQAGEYTVTFKSDEACVAAFTQKINVTKQAAKAEIAAQLNDCSDKAVYLFKETLFPTAVAWNWSFNPGDMNSTAQSPEITFQNEGVYTAVLKVTLDNGCTAADTVLVEANIIKEELTDASFCPGESLALNPTFNPAYEYAWTAQPADPTLTDNKAPNPNVQPDSATTYTVKITKGQCVLEKIVKATPKPTPALSAPDNIAVCDGISAKVTVYTDADPSSVQWSDKADFSKIIQTGLTLDAFVKANSVYYVRADNGICKAFDEVNIIDGSVKLDILPAEYTFCDNKPVTLTAQTTADSSQIEWSATPDFAQIIKKGPSVTVTPQKDAVFYARLINGACIGSDQVKMTDGSISLDILPAEYAFCDNKPVTLTAQTTADSSLVEWSNTPDFAQIIKKGLSVTVTPQKDAIFYARATNGACTGSDQVKMTDGSISLDILPAEYTFCDNKPVTLTAQTTADSSQIEWSATPDFAQIIKKGPSVTVTPQKDAVFYARAVNGACIGSDQVKMTDGSVSVQIAPTQNVVCGSKPVKLTALTSADPSSVQWSDKADFSQILQTGLTLDATPKKNGVYYVRVGNGVCADTDQMKLNDGSVEIDIAPANRSICEGGEAELTITNLNAGDTLQYNWSNNLPNRPNPKVKPTAPESTYQAIVTNQFGCADTAVFKVKMVKVTVDVAVVGKDTICPGESTTLVARANGGTNYLYNWSPSITLTDADAATTKAQPEETTLYTVSVTDEDSKCLATGQVTVYFMTVECREPYIFVPKAFTPNGDGANEMFLVRGINIKEIYFVVYDRWGEKVYETTDPAHEGWNGMHNDVESTPDSYAWYLRATCGNGEIYEKKGNVTLLK